MYFTVFHGIIRPSSDYQEYPVGGLQTRIHPALQGLEKNPHSFTHETGMGTEGNQHEQLLPNQIHKQL